MQETVINAKTILEAAKRAKQFSRTKEQIEAAKSTLEWMEKAKRTLAEVHSTKADFNNLVNFRLLLCALGEQDAACSLLFCLVLLQNKAAGSASRKRAFPPSGA